MTSPHASVTAGLKALNQGDYQRAIATLQAVCQTEKDPTVIIKAQMGLVVAYKYTNETRHAIALCQILAQNSNPKTQAWAVRHLQELDSPPQQDPTGFVLSDCSPLLQNSQSQPVKENADAAPNAQSDTPAITPSLQWRQAGRLKKLQRLPQVNLLPFWLLQAGTAIALFWMIRQLLRWGMSIINYALVKLPYLEPIQLFYRDPTQFVIFTLAILLALSPWLLDALLQLSGNLQPLSLAELADRSPEASRLVQRHYQQRKWRSPQLKLLPVTVPLALTYGNLPRNARIVVTQGLLEQLTANEIATLYATQLGQIAHRDFVVMSLVTVVTQILYVIYWQGSRLSDKSTTLLRMLAGAIANGAYTIWYVLNIPAFWLSQLRIYYSDRFATEITGNPNGLTRALLKITQGIATNIQHQEYTSALLESWNLLAPVSHYQALTLTYDTEIERILTWDLNTSHFLLTINNTHPLIGDRIQRLAQISRKWRLEPEIDLPNRHKSIKPAYRSLLLQGAPYFGVALGFVFGCLLWIIGGIGIWLNIPQLAWMYKDWYLILGCLPIGFSLGTFSRINSFFPDIKSSQLKSNFTVASYLTNPATLPVDSHPVSLQGKLLGRSGASNWLAQDLILQTKHGLVKLHHQSALGLIGKKSPNIQDSVSQSINVIGWLRRGATLWLDIDTWRSTIGNRSQHPTWSTVLACIAAGYGIYMIWRGGT